MRPAVVAAWEGVAGDEALVVHVDGREGVAARRTAPRHPWRIYDELGDEQLASVRSDYSRKTIEGIVALLWGRQILMRKAA